MSASFQYHVQHILYSCLWCIAVIVKRDSKVADMLGREREWNSKVWRKGGFERDLGPMMIVLDFSEFGLRKLLHLGFYFTNKRGRKVE